MSTSIQYNSMKRGDTPAFTYVFSAPYTGFDWTTVLADFAMTNVAAPTDNTGAGVLRTNLTLSTDTSNRATVAVTPTVAESKALTPGSNYEVEIQLKQGSTVVTTPITGKIKVVQDYII
jgi:hypothetical protein